MHCERALAIDPNDAPTHATFRMLLDEAIGASILCVCVFACLCEVSTVLGSLDPSSVCNARNSL